MSALFRTRTVYTSDDLLLALFESADVLVTVTGYVTVRAPASGKPP